MIDSRHELRKVGAFRAKVMLKYEPAASAPLPGAPDTGYIPDRPGRHNHDVVTRAGRGRE
jgi:hypothetical protein